MRTRIKIEGILDQVQDGFRTISTVLDGTELWFKFPAHFHLNSSAELFVACCLLEAMISDRDIEIAADIAISPTLLARLHDLQKIYHCWNHKLKQISIIAPLQQEPAQQHGVASFYSGGVDGSYTLCACLDEISHLIVLKGFDTISKPEQWQQLVDKNQALVDKLNKQLLFIDNNVQDFVRPRLISSHFQHGLTLAGIAIATGFQKVLIPSSFTYKDLFPWGSHPCTDVLWSTASTQIVHHGAELSRTEKTAFITTNPLVFDNLQVCWKNIAHNCGQCSKCLRTMGACYLLNKQSKALPAMQQQQFSNLKLSGLAGVPFLQDLMELAEKRGRTDIARVLRKTLWRFQLRVHAESLFNLLTFGYLMKFVHRIRKTAWVDYRVVMISKD